MVKKNIYTATFKIWIIVSSADPENGETMERGDVAALEPKIIPQNTTFCIKYKKWKKGEKRKNERKKKNLHWEMWPCHHYHHQTPETKSYVCSALLAKKNN